MINKRHPEVCLPDEGHIPEFVQQSFSWRNTHLQQHTRCWIISVRYVFLWHLRTNLPALNHYHGDNLTEVFVWLASGNLIWCLHQLRIAPEFQFLAVPCRHIPTKSTRFQVFAYRTYGYSSDQRQRHFVCRSMVQTTP